jgi:hypothetical protein
MTDIDPHIAAALSRLHPATRSQPDWDEVLHRVGAERMRASGGATAPRTPSPSELPSHQRVYRRATAARSRRRLFPPRARRSPRVMLVGIAVALMLAGGASAIAYRYLGSSPGFKAGFSAFDRLPAATWPPSMDRFGLERSAAYLGLTPAQAEKRLRVLQTGLSLGPGHTQGQGALYAFLGNNGTACVFLTGVLPMVLPGYPGETPALAAIVADNVRTVSLLVNGTATPLAIVNNSVYTSLKDVKSDDTIALEANYADYTSHVFPLANPSGP